MVLCHEGRPKLAFSQCPRHKLNNYNVEMYLCKMLIQKNIVSEFNKFSDNYTEDMINCVPHYEKLINSFKDNLPDLFYSEKILDLGCGNGNSTAVFRRKYPEAKFYLVDASPEMTSICKSRFQDKKMIYHECFFKDLEFREGEFGLICAGFSLHHIDARSRQDLFSKIYSWLIKGGIFVYSDLMIDKQNTSHPQLLNEWELFVNSNYPDGSKWDWLMEHYDAFDHPNNYFDQIEWLKLAGFDHVKMPWHSGFWVHIQAIK